MNLVDLVALDIAGTTLDEGGAVYRMLYDSVRAAGSAAGESDVRAWMGADKRQAVRMLLRVGGAADPSPSELDRVYTDFTTRLASAYQAEPPKPFPGVPEVIALLRERGIAIALMTGFDRAVAELVLAAAGWSGNELIDAVVCADDVAAGRPAPYLIHRAMERTGVTDVARVLVAGDTVLDLDAGTNSGAGFVVGVLTGGMDVVALGQCRHTHLLGGVADLPTLLDVTPGIGRR